MIAGRPAACVLATGIGNRWFAAGRGIARFTGFTR